MKFALFEDERYKNTYITTSDLRKEYADLVLNGDDHDDVTFDDFVSNGLSVNGGTLSVAFTPPRLSGIMAAYTKACVKYVANVDVAIPGGKNKIPVLSGACGVSNGVAFERYQIGYFNSYEDAVSALKTWRSAPHKPIKAWIDIRYIIYDDEDDSIGVECYGEDRFRIKEVDIEM